MRQKTSLAVSSAVLALGLVLGPVAEVASAQQRVRVTPIQYRGEGYRGQSDPYYGNNSGYRSNRSSYYSSDRYRSSSNWNDDYRYYQRNRRRSTGKSVAIIGGTAAGGALIGGLAGGGKGAAIGALVGGVGGLIYDRTTRNKDQRYRR